MRLDLIPAPRMSQPAPLPSLALVPAPTQAPMTGDPCRGHTPVPRWVLVACLAILDGEHTEADPPAQTGARGQA